MKKTMIVGVVLSVLVALASDSTKVFGMDARDYCAAPVGTKLAVVYYQHITSNKWYSDGNKVSKDTNLDLDIGILRPVYFTKIGPFVADPQMLIPFGSAHLDGNDVPGDFESDGFGDPIITATFWLVNKPECRTWLGFTPYFQLPLGEYDHNKPLNLGNNRWMFKEELNFVRGITPKTLFEIGGSVEFYTENDEFGPTKMDLEQDPKFILETKLSYDLSKSAYVAGEYFFTYGGETEIDGVDMDDEARTHSARCTLGFWLSDHYQLLLQCAQDLDVENGPKQTTFSTRFMYLF